MNAKLKLQDGEEELDVCKALEDMKREAARKAAIEATREAIIKAEENTLLQALKNVMETLHLSAEQAMAALKIPETKRFEFAAKL